MRPLLLALDIGPIPEADSEGLLYSSAATAAAARRFMQKYTVRAMMAQMKRPTPAPIPALAPVERPESCETAMYTVPSEPVLIAGMVEVPLAQSNLVSEFVHTAPLLQHPPPRLLAQLNWLVVHPDGISETSVVPGMAVETQDERAQPNPREQQLPPRLEGHLNAL